MDYLSIISGQTFVLASLFLGILIAIVGLAKVFFSSNVIAQRLIGEAEPSSTRRPTVLRKNEAPTSFSWLGKLIAPKSGEKQSQLLEKLTQAGYRNSSSVVTFYAIKALFGIGAFALAVALSPSVLQTSFQVTLLISVVACGVGLMLPNYALIKKVKARQLAIQNGFPDALDMLLVCVEAGLGLDSALQRTALEVETAHLILSEELLIVCDEVRVGKSKLDALTSLVRRTTVEEVASLVTVITQAEQFGTGIADALRVFASEMRNKRMVRAEEKAHKMPVKLSLAVALITMPTMGILFLAPAIISVIKGMSGVAASLAGMK